MSKNIYQGYNLIYEQMKNSVEKPKEAVNPIEIITQIYSFVNTLIIVYKSDSTDLDSILSPILSAKNLNDVKTSITSLVGGLDFKGGNGKQEADTYLSSAFDVLMKVPDINNKFDDIHKKLEELINASKNSVAKTSSIKEAERILLERGHGYLEGGSSSIGTSDVDETPSNKWYIELANHVLDMATAFKSETTPPLLDPAVANNAQVKQILPKASEFLTKAQGLQIDRKRKGFVVKGKIITASGNMKGRDFRIACENLMDEIKRNMGIIGKVKASITKLPPAPIVTPPPPKPTNETPVSPKKQGEQNPPKTDGAVGTCKFPIPISLHVCEQVKQLQLHLMAIPCIKIHLSKHGGADGKYGKFTSMISNIVYSVITKNDKFSSSVLTQEMFDGIMKFPVAKNENVKEIRANKVFEAEANKKEEVLKFEDFESVFNSNKELFEDDTKKITDIDVICKKVNDKIASIGGGGTKPPQDGKDGKDGKDNTTTPEGDPNIKKFKPINDGTYGITFDESVSHFLKNAGLVAAAAAVGVATAGAGTAVIIGAGVAGAGAHELFGGRDHIDIPVSNGYIPTAYCDVIASGLVHTLDGFVSRDDVQAIMQSLCVMKGAFTIENGKAISVWEYVKNKYRKEEKADLSKEASDWGTGIRAIKVFPNFKQRTKTGGETSAEVAKGLIADAVRSLDNNEKNFKIYLKSLDKNTLARLENPEEEEGSTEGETEE